MKLPALILAGALVAGACSTTTKPAADGTVSDGPSSTAADGPTGTPSADSGPTSTATDLPFAPVNTAQPGGVAPGSVGDLDVIQPEELGVALIAVDDEQGAVSWWDGFGWQSFQVDAALGSLDWATDGQGGVLIEDDSLNIWHLEPYSDEPTLVIEAPPAEASAYNSLVGGGMIEGRPYAFVEQGTYGSPETATANIMGFDLEGRADRTLYENTAGWESGTSELAFEGEYGVLTVHAECFSFVVVRAPDGAPDEEVATGPDCASAISGAGVSPWGDSAALAVVDNHDGRPAVLVSRSLGEFPSTMVRSLPLHDNEWRRISNLDARLLISSDGVAIVEDESFRWRRLALTVPGEVRIAHDLAIG